MFISRHNYSIHPSHKSFFNWMAYNFRFWLLRNHLLTCRCVCSFLKLRAKLGSLIAYGMHHSYNQNLDKTKQYIVSRDTEYTMNFNSILLTFVSFTLYPKTIGCAILKRPLNPCTLSVWLITHSSVIQAFASCLDSYFIISLWKI